MSEPLEALKWPPLRLSLHPQAPVFQQDQNPQLILRQLISEMSSPNFSATDSIRELLRQAGLVSLWFYLKFIAGYSGPYDLLNTDLHVDMANFRQLVAETPGIKAAGLTPRSCFKSTIWTHGANPWELIRNPNLRIGCTSEIYDRALSFVQTAISTFEENEFHQWLYPEHRKVNRDGIELVLTSRTKRYVEPNLKAITAGGSTQGIHVDLFDCDDVVGESMLNADHCSTADMVRMGNWLHSNMRTLVVSWKKSRVLIIGTRYAIDDPYEPIMRHTSHQLGYWDEIDYPRDPEGEWVVYYRPAVQAGLSINPEAFTVESLRALMEDNPWLVQTQYMNNPFAAGVSDFAQYRPGKVQLDWSDIEDQYQLRFPDGETIWLRDCDVLSTGDPAASTHQVGARTSKSATVVIAHTADDRIVVLEADSGFVEPTRFFDWLLSYKKKYEVVLRSTYVEAQAGFKSFPKVGRREMFLRGEELNILPIPALGDKVTTIRNILQPYLNRGKFYIREELYGKVMDELRTFPSLRMDLLDAIKLGIFKSYRPEGTEGPSPKDDDDDHPPVRRSKSHSTRSSRHISAISGY